ncbi:MAG: hypothetical protein HY039_05080 [Nitrospirae bacterium]|nr:hypothetical protein [Nitrospirota bacterium]
MIRLVLVYLHVLGAAVWIGGLAYAILVLNPILRSFPASGALPDADWPATRKEIERAAGSRFHWVKWTAIVALLATGAALLAMTPMVGRKGVFLAVKVSLALLMVFLTWFHHSWLGPWARRLAADDPWYASSRLALRWMARATLIAGLIVVGLGLALGLGIAA